MLLSRISSIVVTIFKKSYLQHDMKTSDRETNARSFLQLFKSALEFIK